METLVWAATLREVRDFWGATLRQVQDFWAAVLVVVGLTYLGIDRARSGSIGLSSSG